jgi:hypothetical protein
MVLEEVGCKGDIGLSDLVEPEFVEWFLRTRGRRPKVSDLVAMSGSKWRDFSERFGVCVTKSEAASLKYIPMLCVVPDLPLEKMGNLCLTGKGPLQLYEEWLSLCHPDKAG